MQNNQSNPRIDKSENKSENKNSSNIMGDEETGAKKNQPNQVTQTKSSGGKEMAAKEESGKDGARKSIGAVIAQSLAEESQEGVDRILGEIKTGFEVARDYVVENPREAAGLAVCAGVVAWALLGTKPGRKVFEAGTAVAVPYATKWVARNLSAVTH
jgi:ElaB/YqjD/DUF883 family membrane-anchored ribosome-binding protein